MELSISNTCSRFRAMAAFPSFYKKKTQGFLCFGATGISSSLLHFSSLRTLVTVSHPSDLSPSGEMEVFTSL